MPGPHLSLVRDFPFFAGLGDEDLQVVLRAAIVRRIARKGTAFQQGQPAREFFVLLNGHLKVMQATLDGRRVIVRIVEPGEPYGLAVALGRPDYPATAIAIEESLTLVWPSSAWASLIERAPILGTNALRISDSACRKHTPASERSRRKRSSVALPTCCCEWSGKAGTTRIRAST